jgi:hypothetical protein
MNATTAPGNTGRVVTRFAYSPNVSQHQNHQSEAMNAALMVRYQYSRKAKSHFSQQCLDHLKASLCPVQDISV